MRLMVWDGRGVTPAYNLREPSVGEVVVWLREQGAGEERHSWWSVSSYVIGPVKSGPYLVIPLDTEPPKETE